MRDIYDEYRLTTVLLPVLVLDDATGNGTGTDLLGYEGAILEADYGAVGDLHDGSNYATIKFLESSNNVVFSAIADTDLIGGNNTAVIDANASGNSTHQRGYIGNKRYVTVSIAIAGTMANGTPASAHVVKGPGIHKKLA